MLMPTGGSTCIITLPDDQAFSVAPGDTILSAALRAGVGFPHECCAGGCGACRFDLLSGELSPAGVDAPGLSERDRARGKRLACQSLPLGDCAIKVRVSDEYVPPIRPRRLQAVFESAAALTGDMRMLRFRTGVPAAFLPGQFALLSCAGDARQRAYSMSNLPNGEGVWEFIVRRVPGGYLSNRLFDALRPGEQVELDGPYGGAWFRSESPREVVCIGGGSGLAPVLSIARSAASRKQPTQVHFYYGARTAADVCGEALLAELPAAKKLIRYRAAVSTSDSAWSGPTGFIHELVEAELGERLTDFDFYLAGPPPMVSAVQEMLVVRHRVPHAQVHFDRFF